MSSDVKQRKFEILAAELRNQIRHGILKPGDRLPTLAEINSKSGITNPTILRAHSLLEREGLITRRRGHGTFVATQDHQDLLAGPMAKTIVVLTPFGVTPTLSRRAPGWAHFTTAGILEGMHAAGYHAVMLHPDTIRNADIEWLAMQQPFGVIIDDNYFSDLDNLRLVTETFSGASVSVVALGNLPFWSRCDRVVSDHAQGAYELTQWLIAQGRRHIVPVYSSKEYLDWMAKRLSGYTQAMEEAGLKPLQAIVSPELPSQPNSMDEFSQYSRQCAAGLIEAMTGPTPCDALMAVSDGPAYYYAAACRLFGKEPNQDILIAGYDNYWQETSERQWETANPDVTIDKDNHCIGKELVRLLMERNAGNLPSEPQLRLIPPILVPVMERSGVKI